MTEVARVRNGVPPAAPLALGLTVTNESQRGGLGWARDASPGVKLRIERSRGLHDGALLLHSFQPFRAISSKILADISIRQLLCRKSVYVDAVKPNTRQRECTPWCSNSATCWRPRGQSRQPWWGWHVSRLTWQPC